MSSTSTGANGSVLPFDVTKQWFALRKASICCFYFLDHLKPDSVILDVGSGPGSITIDLAQLVPQGHVTGFEISPDMVQDSEVLASHRGVTNVSFMQGNATDLLSHFPATKFDCIHAHMVLLHIPDPVSVIKKMRALLKPGGFIAIRDQTNTASYPPQLSLDNTDTAWRAVTKARGANPMGGAYNHTWIHEAGFPWDKIQWGSASFEIPREHKGVWVKAMHGTLQSVAQALEELDLMHVIEMKKGDTELMVKNFMKAWDSFEKDPSARYMTMSGWVIGWL